MRVRLFEFGKSRSDSVVRIDQFPVKLSIDNRGSLTQKVIEDAPVCLIEDRGGELFLHASGHDPSICINDAVVESGPLMCGDCLSIGHRQYVVSYEQTACEYRSAMKVRVFN